MPTLANAMDVGNPSNFERLAFLSPDVRQVRVELVGDEEIRSRIASEYCAERRLLCPHSATAVEAWGRLEEREERPWIVAATAHPYKFAEVVDPLVGCKVEPSAALEAIAGRGGREIQIRASLDALVDALDGSSTARSNSSDGDWPKTIRSAAFGPL